jgi:hypothetical protein
MLVRLREQWPLLLCGPILRRVEPRSVSVFVALKHARKVKLSLYLNNPDPAGDPRDLPIGATETDTVALGKFLHVAVVTIKLPSPEVPLEPATLYAYDVSFTRALGAPSDDSPATTDLSQLKLLEGDHALGYVKDKLPSFCLPPGLNDLRIMHSSCRKPHATGVDALSALDKIIEDARTNALLRPHQLLLTGDQIYADDVSLSLLGALTATGALLLDWEEKLPGVKSPSVEGPSVAADRKANDPVLDPGKRHLIVNPQAGYSSGEAPGHLMFLSEFYAMYLFAWSDVLWPRDGAGKITLPVQSEVIKPDRWPLQPKSWPPDSLEHQQASHEAKAYTKALKAAQKHHDEGRTFALNYAANLPLVRRALANVPTYMIFDDHEVTDDWYLHKDWYDRVRIKPLGIRLMRNALTAYAVFQDWGNQPNSYDSGVGASVLTAAKSWTTGSFDPTGRLESLLDVTGPPGKVGSRCVWDYEIPGAEHKVIVLDTRTWRQYPLAPAGNKQTRPAALIDMSLSDDVLKRQLDDRKPQITVEPMTTIVISPAPVQGYPFVEQDLQPIGVALAGEETLDNEPWLANTAAYQILLKRLARFGRVVILSGDVHYAFSSHTAYFDERSSNPSDHVAARLVQFCSSASKNEGTITLPPHLKDVLLGESEAEGWMGFSEPPPVEKSAVMFQMVNLAAPLRKYQILRALDETPSVLPSNGWGPIKPTTAMPKWRYRIIYLHDERPDKDRLPDTISSGIDVSGRPLKTEVKWARRQLYSLLQGGLGREAVGANNIGELKFEWDEPDVGDRWITQYLWWRPWGEEIGLSTLTIHKAPLNEPSTNERPEFE